MDKEIWDWIPGYEDLYVISTHGRVSNLRIMLKTRRDKYGYERISLTSQDEEGTKQLKTYLVHRLVAETFVPNPNGLECVLHNDGNRLNNHSDNLSWGRKNKKRGSQYDKRR